MKWGRDLRISAPPMAAVVVYPFRKLRTAFPARHAAPIRGAPGAKARKVAIVPKLRPRRVQEMARAWDSNWLGGHASCKFQECNY
jgi:hypothetical protein